MVQSPSLEPGQKMAALWNSNIRCRIHMSLQLVCILSHINPVLARPAYDFKTHCSLSVCLYLFIHPSIQPSVCPSVYLIYLSVRPSILSYIHLGFPSSLFTSGFPTNTLHILLFAMHATCLTHLVLRVLFCEEYT